MGLGLGGVKTQGVHAHKYLYVYIHARTSCIRARMHAHSRQP